MIGCFRVMGPMVTEGDDQCTMIRMEQTRAKEIQCHERGYLEIKDGRASQREKRI